MKLQQLYSESIKNLAPSIIEGVLRESPHTRIVKPIPPELSLLNGTIVDLGFENLGLSSEIESAIRRHFIADGVRIPNTVWKLRYLKTATTVVEQSTGNEFALPEHWMRAVLVLGEGDDYKWIGSDVRPEQIVGTSLDDYVEVKDGYIPK
jgi:hypothetical protein